MEADRKYTTHTDGRMYRWVRLEPGKGGRKQAWGKTPEDVETAASRIEAEFLESKRPKPKPAEPLPIEVYAPGTFGEFVYGVYVKVAYAGAEPTTKALYDYYLRAYVLPVLEHRPIAAVDLADMLRLESYVARAENRRGGSLAPKTQREIVMRAREVMGLYVRMEEANGRTPRKEWILHKAPKAPAKKVRVEVESDYSVRLLNAAKGHVFEGPLICILYLGMRRGEVAAMKQSSLDWKHQRVRILEKRHALSPDGSLPKGGKTRDVPAPAAIMEALDRLRSKTSIYLWVDENAKPIHPDRLTHDVPEFCEKHGLERKTPHELRSLCATNLLAIGADPVLVMEILGHAKLDTSLIYFDPRAADKRAALAKLLAG